jgi:SAM-dependent methyltransferase
LTQDNLFWQSEGNKWFLRNKAVLIGEDRLTSDPVLRLIELTGLTPKNVLERGASNGSRLHALQQRFNCTVTAVEPSQEAIDDGLMRYSEITFLRGLASDIPIQVDGQFDLVVINFVFHWIDRSRLLRSVAEIDRMLADSGYLIVGDFYPSHPERVSYHHLPEANVWTYKQSYCDIFLTSNLYELITFLVLDHATHQVGLKVDPKNRSQVALLRKTLDGRYETAQFDS